MALVLHRRCCSEDCRCFSSWQPRSLSAARTSGTSKAEVRFHGPSIDSQELPEPVDPQSVRQRQPPPEVLAAMEIAALQELSCASHSSGMRDRDRSQLKRGDIHKEKGLHSSMPAATLLLTGPRGPMHTRTGSTRLNCRPDRRTQRLAADDLVIARASHGLFFYFAMLE
jgi:hypothetical protein